MRCTCQSKVPPPHDVDCREVLPPLLVHLVEQGAADGLGEVAGEHLPLGGAQAKDELVQDG